jgi:ketosteroid isomerase-like protein
MAAQTSVPPPTAHPNALRIETLYTAIQNADLTAIAACYDEHAYFQDIAFRRRGKKEIMEMWRYACHGMPQVTFDSNAISADDRQGSGRWRAKYMFGKTDTKAGRPVDNTISSAFAFRDGGLIVKHRDRCDAMAWARQAFPFPISLVAGSLAPLRRCMAALKLYKFSKEAKP